jgi:DNA invertase Pin-like site-specific DNA recombinase
MASNCAYCEQNIASNNILNINLCGVCAQVLNARRPTLAQPDKNSYIYVRVSTKEQNADMQSSIFMQVRQCIEYCFDNNIACMEIFEDVHSARDMRSSGLSGLHNMLKWLGFEIYNPKTDKRRTMDDIKDALHRSEILLIRKVAEIEPHIDYVIVANVDRFGRDTLNMLNIKKQLSSYGTHIISVGQNIKTGNDLDEMEFNRLALESELFSRDRSIRLKRVKSAKKAMGSFVGGLPMFGRRVIKRDGKRVLHGNPREQRIIERIRKLRLQKRSYADIAEFLNTQNISRRGKAWTTTSVRSIYCDIAKYLIEDEMDDEEEQVVQQDVSMEYAI